MHVKDAEVGMQVYDYSGSDAVGIREGTIVVVRLDTGTAGIDGEGGRFWTTQISLLEAVDS